jgi:hypothetical protein
MAAATSSYDFSCHPILARVANLQGDVSVFVVNKIVNRRASRDGESRSAMVNLLRNVEFWRIAVPSVISLIVPYITYRLITKKLADYQSGLNMKMADYQAELNRGLEDHKKGISKELEIHKVQLQASFQTRFYQFQTRFSWLHQKRAEAIEKLYVLLAKVEGDLNVWITSSHELRNQTEDEHYRAAEDHFQEMINFFDEKRIYFDQETINAVLVITQAARMIYDWHPEVQRTRGPAPQFASFLKQHATTLKEQNIGPLMGLLEDRFRKLLDAETPISAMERPDGVAPTKG